MGLSLDMGNTAIRVESLSKRYRIGLEEQTHETLAGQLTAYLKSPLRNLRRLRRLTRFSGNERDPNNVIWALRSVSFEVERGEVVGIIGPNGAGKSTLLKVLSRITYPTSGRVSIKGRVSSLLEVGTGFHPELTGRDNIYLNGTILGMRKIGVDRKFDEIVSFSGVEKFIDTPVKRYSSGMRMRLAFSVAAHLEPEILLIDEVLSVGDAEFQKKCLGKMHSVAKKGRTVLFVSHNLGAVNRLCRRCILLYDGRIRIQGSTQIVTAKYLQSQNPAERAVIDTRKANARSGTGEGKIIKVSVFDQTGSPSTVIGIGQPFRVQIEIDVAGPSPDLVVGLEVKRLDGLPIANIRSDSQGMLFEVDGRTSRTVIEIGVPSLPLYPGRYLLEPWFAFNKGRRVDQLHGELSVTLESCGVYKSELMIQPGRGIVIIDCEWKSRNVRGASDNAN